VSCAARTQFDCRGKPNRTNWPTCDCSNCNGQHSRERERERREGKRNLLIKFYTTRSRTTVLHSSFWILVKFDYETSYDVITKRAEEGTDSIRLIANWKLFERGGRSKRSGSSVSRDLTSTLVLMDEIGPNKNPFKRMQIDARANFANCFRIPFDSLNVNGRSPSKRCCMINVS
jgi:hypothetical protein